MEEELSQELITYWLSADASTTEAILCLMDIVALSQVDVVSILSDDDVLITPHKLLAIRRIADEMELTPDELLWLIKASDAEITMVDWQVSSANYQLVS